MSNHTATWHPPTLSTQPPKSLTPKLIVWTEVFSSSIVMLKAEADPAFNLTGLYDQHDGTCI